jgi:hypothetical protein
VIEHALVPLADAEHPAGRDEHRTFTAGPRPALVAVDDGLDPSAAITLTATDSAPSFVALEVVA